MFAVRHALNRHSNAKIEQSRGQLPLTASDVAAIQDVVESPDAYILGLKTPRGQDVIGRIRRMPDGTILYLEEVRSGRKTLAMTSMRKYPGTSDFDAIKRSTLPTNARSDTGDVRIVYPDGGNGQASDIRFSRTDLKAAMAAHARISKNGVTSHDDLRDMLRVPGYSQWAQSTIVGDVGATKALRAELEKASPGYDGKAPKLNDRAS